jgi:8-oxo-dGTP diphosphatase
MKDYEMDVEESPPPKHIKMMHFVDSVLAKAHDLYQEWMDSPMGQPKPSKAGLIEKYKLRLTSIMQMPDDWVGQDLEDWQNSIVKQLSDFAAEMEGMREMSMNMIKYVVGFAFSEDLRTVALILKTHPEWQKGFLNGVGGHIEIGESPTQAMIREFKEETGCDTIHLQWSHYARMTGNNNDGLEFTCDCLATIIPDLFLNVKSVTDEVIQFVHLGSLVNLSEKMIDNLPWLIMAAIDHLQDGRPNFIKIEY